MIDLSPSKPKAEVSRSNFFLYLLLAFIAILILLVYSKVSSMQDDFRYISSETVKVRNTRAALLGAECLSCHGPDTPARLLPLRSLNSSSFKNYLRGERVGLGYSTCPSYNKELLSDSELSKIYAILYGGNH